MTSHYSSLNYIFTKIFVVGVHNFNYYIEVCSNSAMKLVRGKRYFTNKIKPFGRFVDDHRQSYMLIYKVVQNYVWQQIVTACDISKRRVKYMTGFSGKLYFWIS